jgi:hypothetical protein
MSNSEFSNNNSEPKHKPKRTDWNINKINEWTPSEIYDWISQERVVNRKILNELFLKAIEDNNIDFINKVKDIIHINYQNIEGNTPLHIAVAQNNIELVSILLDVEDEFGQMLIDLHIKNNEGLRALNIAVNKGYTEIINLIKAKSKINNESNILGRGAYGAILSPALPNINNHNNPVYFPNNVTKIGIFGSTFNPRGVKARQKEVERRIGYNEGHRVNLYRKRYTGNNISLSLKDFVAHSNTWKSYQNDDNIDIVRMPYLGINFSEIKEGDNLKSLRNVPIIDILQQFLKLMTQVYKLWYNTDSNYTSAYVHGDIRPYNIMILPKNGRMTLIDFDFLDDFSYFYELYYDMFGFYSNPPEFLSFKLKGESEPIQKDIINTYTDSQYESFTALKNIYPTKNELNDAIIDAINKNKIYLQQHFTEAKPKNILKTFDSFGLVNTLLVFVDDVYPGIIGIERISKADFYETMKPLFPMYTPEHLKAYTDAIYDITYDVLLPMSDLVIEKRMTIDVGLRKMRTILASLTLALESNENRANREKTMTALRGLEQTFRNPLRRGFAVEKGGRRRLRSKGTKKRMYPKSSIQLQKRTSKLNTSRNVTQTRRK